MILIFYSFVDTGSDPSTVIPPHSNREVQILLSVLFQEDQDRQKS